LARGGRRLVVGGRLGPAGPAGGGGRRRRRGAGPAAAPTDTRELDLPPVSDTNLTHLGSRLSPRRRPLRYPRSRGGPDNGALQRLFEGEPLVPLRRSEALLEALRMVAPGTPLRDGIDRILQASKGALIVVGDGPEVLAVCSGGL